ncbi:MAG TPA: VCBS repeat-containing protein, partial [Dissulfurispiraceae bacterium]|nr:VCBS repeat-containing protein [Dissulfurispiraceae bacterium]
EEDTARNMNRSGIETMPFMRLNFADIDGSGLEDMIIGNKNGYVYLYKNSGDPTARPWQQIAGYFEGIKAGAFSSPALADLDGDGKAELVIGTGGFSSDSGKMFFFRNEGNATNPSWKRIDGLYLSIGNDAAVTVVDYNLDGRPGIIACNSEGKIIFFKNTSSGGNLKFVRDPNPPVRANFGMYAVPTAKKIGSKVFLAVGNSMGKLFLFEITRGKGGLSSRQIKTGLKSKAFASPAFASLVKKERVDLVVADGDGVISYYENIKGDFSALHRKDDLFSNRVFAGPVCTPTVSCIGDKTYMVVGNMDGTLRLFEYRNSARGIPWTEKPGYFSGIKVKGFSRGVLTSWEGENMLVVGQGNGNIRAFVNAGKKKTAWKEKARFFEGVSVKEHSTPVIFDPDGDGKWCLISGSGDGRIYAFRIKGIKKGLPVWERIDGTFDDVRVDGFSVPTVVKDEKSLYLFVGQQDGRIRTFRADIDGKPFDYRKLRFTENGLLEGIRMSEHSSPFVSLNNGVFDVVSGDYNGNLRHFLCKKGLL